ncbi:MAG: hypothetical protein JNL74_05715, partial [Fibrobacteres bacterium]|nr:hypothetical protein [Fibrobacterota bacterium]
VLSNNIDYLESAKQRVDLNFVFSSVPGSSGMRPDYSLHHHEYQLHTGSYGVQFAHDGARYLYFTQNTSYAPSPIRKQRFMDYVAYGICWSTYNRYFTPSVIGRSITRSGADASEGLFAMLILSTMPGTQKELFLKASSKMIETWTTRLPVAIAATLSGLSQEKEWPSGFRHYPYSDLSIKRNSSYFATLKTLSPRTSAGEYVNTEGRKSWHLSDGFLYLVLKGNEYAANHFWPTFNWTRFPGTTIEQKPYPMPAGNAILGTGKVDFSGATSIDDIGVTAMQFGGVVSTALPGLETSLQAKKSWFFFGKEIVCIGSSINCSSDSLVETVIDQRRLNSENSPLIIDNTTKSTSLDGEKKYPSAKHIYTDSIGYFFPESSIIYVSRLKQNGRWSELGQGDTVLRQSPVQTIHINHGRRPLNGSYAYAMLPAISQSELAAYSLNPDISILANNDSVHAVYNKAKSTTGIVFWKACSYNGLTVNLPCIILKKTLPG